MVLLLKISKKMLGHFILAVFFLPAVAYAEPGQYDLPIAVDEKNIECNLQVAENGSLMNFGRDFAREAITECTKGIELNPQDTDCYNRRAAAYRSLNKPYLAIEDYNRVLKIDVKNTEAFHGKYEILMGSQMYHYSESYVNDTSYNPFPK